MVRCGLANQSEFFARFFEKTKIDDLLHADGTGHFRVGAQEIDQVLNFLVRYLRFFSHDAQRIPER